MAYIPKQGVVMTDQVKALDLMKRDPEFVVDIFLKSVKIFDFGKKQCENTVEN